MDLTQGRPWVEIGNLSIIDKIRQHVIFAFLNFQRDIYQKLLDVTRTHEFDLAQGVEGAGN